MKQTKHLFTVLALLFIALGASAQEHFPIINKDILYRQIGNDTSDSRFFMAVIFVNYCHGVADIRSNIQMVDSVTSHKTQFFLCQSSDGDDRTGGYLEKVLKHYGLEDYPVFYLDNRKYNTNKGDNRLQGAAFRNDICSNCSFYSVVSGTFYIILDKKKNNLFSGFKLDREQLAAILTCDK